MDAAEMSDFSGHRMLRHHHHDEDDDDDEDEDYDDYHHHHDHDKKKHCNKRVGMLCFFLFNIAPMIAHFWNFHSFKNALDKENTN